MSKVAFITLGCKVNQYETNAMSQEFIEKGYEKRNQIVEEYKRLNSLTELPNSILVRWKNNYEKDRTNDALDEFYCLLFNIKF